jgi:putative flippase GtrA
MESSAMPSHASALTRSTIASLIATAGEFILLWAMVHPLKLPHWISYFTVQFFCNVATFLLYKYWAFEAAEYGDWKAQYLKQLVIFGGSLLLNTAIPSLLSYHFRLEPVTSFAISQVVTYLGWNYPGNRYWVFRR